MKPQVLLPLVAALVVASPALAQNYVVTRTTQTFVPLTNATDITSNLVPTGSFSAIDEGYTSISLPFAFPYYGSTYNSVGVTSNGLFLFGTAANTFCSTNNCLVNRATPATSPDPHSFITPWWDDLKGNANGKIKYVSTPSEVVVEFSDWGPYSGTGSLNFQVRLNASGLFQVHYGPISGTTPSATVGFENLDGTAGNSLFTCAGGAGSCTSTDWVPDSLVTVGTPVAADLVVESVALSNSVKSGSNLSLTVTPTFRNFGQTPANGFQWQAYLSTDRFLDAQDQLIFTSTTAVSCAGTSTCSASGAANATNVPSGQYYVLVQADPAPASCTTNCGAVNEFSESNNVGSTATYFTFGIDLVARSISGPSASGPGNAITVQVDWINQGTDPAPTPNNLVGYKIVVSADQTITTSDFVVYSGTETVTGTSTFQKSLTFPLPNNVPGGDFYWGLIVDPAGEVTELKTNNAAASSAKVKITQADLVALNVELLDPYTLAKTRTAYIGERARVSFEMANVGGADARDFKVGVIISTDANMSKLADTEIHAEPVGIVAQGVNSQQISFEFVIPFEDKNHRPYTNGNYYIYLLADTYSDVTELNEQNNLRAVGAISPEQILFHEPAPDYVVGRVDVPASAGAGEIVPVYRLLRNAGNKNAGTATYRYVASANEIITPDDLPIPMLGANGQDEDTRDVTLSAGQTQAATEFVRLPPDLVPGAWYIGVLLDTNDAVVELDEKNNAGASAQPVQVATPSLMIANQQLPDATVSQPYNFKLSATGAHGQANWHAVDPAAVPAGLSVSQDGVITGIPTAPSISTFEVVAEDAGRLAKARLVLRVLEVSSELVINSYNLPPVVTGAEYSYSANLAASGGARPYTWSVSGTLPSGIKMDSNGVFTGTTQTSPNEFPLSVDVRDAVGARTHGSVKLKVVEPGSIYIETSALTETMVGTDYLCDLVAKNTDESSLVAPLTWSIASGSLPEGMTLTTEAGSVGLLTGKPIVSGSFQIGIQVVDAKGRSDVADFVLRVHPARLKLSAVNLPTVIHPGDQVDFQITTGSNNSQYRIFSGNLAPGLSMDQSGHIKGAVDMETSLGTWNFIVEGKDSVEGESLGAFALEVTPSPEKSGCNVAPGRGGGGLLWTLVAPVLALFARRRRATFALASAAVAAVVLVAPAQADAQTSPYQVVGPSANSWTPVTGTKVNGLNASTAITVALPFPFKFFDITYTSVNVALHGYLSFPTNSSISSNVSIPHSNQANPTYIAAPWWDLLNLPPGANASAAKYATTGAAPNRVFTVEWSVCAASNCLSNEVFSFQAQLYEGTNKIRFAYRSMGKYSNSATVGIQGPAQPVAMGSPVLTCSTSANCTSTLYPANFAFDMLLPADLQVSALNANDTGFAGVSSPVSTLIANKGGTDAKPIVVDYYLSQDAQLNPETPTVPGDKKVGSSTLPYVAGNVTKAGSGTATATVAGTAPGAYNAQLKITKAGASLAAGTAAFKYSLDGGMTLSNEMAVPVTGAFLIPGTGLTVTWVNGTFVVGDVYSFATTAGTLVANTEKLSTGTLDIPVGMAPGNYYLFAIVDPAKVVTESAENNNVGVPLPFKVGGATPDLTVASITAAQPAASATDLSVSFSVKNVGNAATTSTSRMTYFLSDNSVVSQSDTVLATDTVPVLSAGQENNQTNVSVQLPPGLKGGKYWIGLCVDYDPVATPKSTVTEIFETNNCVTGSSFVYTNGALVIVTTSLPGATQHGAYGVPLEAAGGSGGYAWILDNGRLPNGMNLASNGDLVGTPTESGSFPFSVKVQSGTAPNVEFATQSLTLTVSSNLLPLAVIDQVLPSAEFGKSYGYQIAAIGGRAPYTWSLAADSHLPEGLGLSTDGFIEGRAAQVGDAPFEFTVEVTDADNVKANRPLDIRVVKPSSLSIATTRLTIATVGKEYRQVLSAIGGTAPYTWNAIKFQKLAENPTEVPGDVLGAIPEWFGVNITPEGSGVALRGLPKQAGLYSLTVSVKDDGGVMDTTTMTLLVTYDKALSILNTALPDAFLTREYNVKLASNSTLGVTWTVACVQQAISGPNNSYTYACAEGSSQTLPAGISLSAEGELTGVATAGEGVYSFLVKAVDENGRQDVRGFSINVRPAPEAAGGCSGTGLEPVALSILALVGLGQRRRSRR